MTRCNHVEHLLAIVHHAVERETMVVEKLKISPHSRCRACSSISNARPRAVEKQPNKVQHSADCSLDEKCHVISHNFHSSQGPDEPSLQPIRKEVD